MGTREELLQQCEEALTPLLDEHEPELCRLPDELWRNGVRALRGAALGIFARKSSDDPLYVEWSKERLELLKLRRDARFDLQTCDEKQLMIQKNRLKAISIKCKRSREAWTKKIKAHRLAEIEQAWREHRDFDVAKLCRLVAGTGLGPRRRYYRAIPIKKTTAEWKELLERPATKSGMSATIVDYEKERNSWINEADALPHCDVNYGKVAADDLKEIRRAFLSCSKRRMAPSWSLPNEIWTMLLWPNWRLEERWSSSTLKVKAQQEMEAMVASAKSAPKQSLGTLLKAMSAKLQEQKNATQNEVVEPDQTSERKQKREVAQDEQHEERLHNPVFFQVHSRYPEADQLEWLHTYRLALQPGGGRPER